MIRGADRGMIRYPSTGGISCQGALPHAANTWVNPRPTLEIVLLPVGCPSGCFSPDQILLQCFSTLFLLCLK